MCSKRSVLSLLLASVCSTGLFAQTDTSKLQVVPTPVQKLYWSNGFDAAIFSTTLMQKTGQSDKLTTLRFTYEINFGFNLNYDFNNHVGLYTGLGIKNIGFIEKEKDSTIKRRVYAIGMPVGLKIGNFRNRNFVVLGGGADVPVNYREKGYKERKHKEKFNEWFSDRTPLLMPYMFVGVSVAPGVIFKLQYYPNNFLNTNYRDKGMPQLPDGSYVKPYAAYEKTNLILLSIGYDIHYKKPKKMDDAEDEAGMEPAAM